MIKGQIIRKLKKVAVNAHVRKKRQRREMRTAYQKEQRQRREIRTACQKEAKTAEGK